MELIMCFALAVSAFVLIITAIVGLVSAPTPVLLAILVAGMMLTQKSINKFKVPEIKLEERGKNEIESVTMALDADQVIAEKNQEIKPQKPLTSMTYRGFHYRRIPHLDKTISVKTKPDLQYRGVKASPSKNV